MTSREPSRHIRRILPQLTVWGGLALVCAVFGGYAYFLKVKEIRTQELFLGELRYLRQENHTFIEKIKEFELQCGADASEEAGSQSLRPPDEETAPEAAPAAERSFVYHVKRGDTIWDIAAIYQVEVESLMRWNKLTPRSRIFPGDQLTIILEE